MLWLAPAGLFEQARVVLDEAGRNPAAYEVRLLQERAVERNGCLRPSDNELLERPPAATDRRLPVVCPDDELQQQRVEVRRDLLVRPDATVDPHAGSARGRIALDAARRRHEIAQGDPSLDPELDRVPARLRIPPGGDPLAPPAAGLLSPQVDPEDGLRHRMLDLEP